MELVQNLNILCELGYLVIDFHQRESDALIKRIWRVKVRLFCRIYQTNLYMNTDGVGALAFVTLERKSSRPQGRIEE